MPKRFAGVVQARRVRRSLQTSDPIVARERARAIDAELEKRWSALLAGEDLDVEKRYEAAIAYAESRGFQYKAAAELTDAEEIIARMDALPDDPQKATTLEVEALLGGAKPPPVSISKALEFYFEKTSYERASKSPTQLRIVLNGRRKVVAALIETIGDKDVRDIDREDMVRHFSRLKARVEAGEIAAESANKDLGQLRVVLRTVAELKGFTPPPMERISFKVPKKRKGENREVLPFSIDWIQDRLLAPDALAELNVEARRVVYAMVETGLRPSEIVNILPENILLDHDIPHVRVTITEKRDVKTVNAERRVPLVGVSLMAFEAQPAGFPRYFDKNPQLSALVSKYFKTRALIPSPKHTLYSLRHSFEDRLIAADLDYRVRKNVMGHQVNDVSYGIGADLAQVRDVLERIAFRPPPKV